MVQPGTGTDGGSHCLETRSPPATVPGPAKAALELEINSFATFESPIVDKILSTLGLFSAMGLGNKGLAVRCDLISVRQKLF